MFPLASHPTILAASASSVGWLEASGEIAGAIAICLLAGLLAHVRRSASLQSTEQARLMANERDTTKQVRLEREAFARESQGKSEMLATLSREVRAHLNGIVGSADLMLDNSLAPSQREHLSTLRASAEALHQSLNDILDYASIESGKLHIEKAPFDLREPLIEVIEHLSPLAVLKGLELVLIIAPDTPLMVTGDAARLRQFLLNLLSNAVRFTSVGRVVLRVELPQSSGTASGFPQNTTWLHFSVSDTGAGIPEEMHATIFDRFAQSDSPSPRKFGGSGLELAISYKLVELMGGKMGVRSLPESGTEFWALLPLGSEKEQPAPSAAPRKGLQVVVLDDVAAARVGISAMLTRLGFDHDSVDTAAKAVVLLHDAYEAGVGELVLLVDESVARDSADTIDRLLKEEPALAATRIVLISPEPESAMAAGHRFPIVSVLRKPVVRADLLLRSIHATQKLAAVPTVGGGAAIPASTDPKSPVGLGPYVLVVDDDEISRAVASQLLQRLGCKVERALSGLEAIERTRHAQFDLIFMDCQMPDLDGFDTTRRIRSLAGEKAPPIVALTANTTAKDREKCFAAGMCDFVDKPVRKAELDRILKRWTKSVRAPDA